MNSLNEMKEGKAKKKKKKKKTRRPSCPERRSKFPIARNRPKKNLRKKSFRMQPFFFLSKLFKNLVFLSKKKNFNECLV